jgi:hypothetical protein
MAVGIQQAEAAVGAAQQLDLQLDRPRVEAASLATNGQPTACSNVRVRQGGHGQGIVDRHGRLLQALLHERAQHGGAVARGAAPNVVRRFHHQNGTIPRRVGCLKHGEQPRHHGLQRRVDTQPLRPPIHRQCNEPPQGPKRCRRRPQRRGGKTHARIVRVGK